MNRQRILFVDDDPLAVDGLRDFFRKDQHRWELVLAASGESALAEFAAAPSTSSSATCGFPTWMA